MRPERLQEIRDSELLLHGEEQWTNEEDVVTEAVIKELIAAVEDLQALGGWWGERHRIEIADLRAQLAASQTEVEQLEERDEMAKRLADYCRMTIETGVLNYGSSIAVAYRDYMATREEQKESKK